MVTAWFACGGAELEDAADLDDSALSIESVALHHPEFARKLRDIDGYRTDEARLQGEGLESLCGPRDLQHVNSYNGRLGVSQTYVKKYKGAVGALTSKNTPTGSKYCTGTLIGKDLFLTASHCVSSKTVGHFVAFGYERKAGSTALGTQEFYKITQLVEEGAKKSPAIDYAIVRLERDAGSKYGVTKMRAEDPKKDATLAIIQHPSGEPKQIEAGKHQGLSGNYLRYADIDTLPGSSGSGVLDADGLLVGVHTNGGCTSGSSGANSGVRLSQAAKVSSIIR
jgi:V8-like Glu-specific endopeptidase